MSAQTLQFRRSERVRVSFPIQVFAGDDSDAPLSCETRLVNLNGCGLKSPVAIPVGIKVRLKFGNDEIPGRVVTCIQAPIENAYSVGIKLDQKYYWKVPNAPADWLASPDWIPQAKNSAAADSAAAPRAASPQARAATTAPKLDALHSALADMMKRAREQSEEASARLDESVKQVNAAVERAEAIARGLEALTKGMPAQLESQIAQKVQEAATAAHTTATESWKQRVEADLERMRSQAVQQKKSLEDGAGKKSHEEMIREFEGRLREAAANGVAEFEHKIESAAAAYSELQNVTPAQQLLDRLDSGLRAADGHERTLAEKQSAFERIQSRLENKAAEGERVTAKLAQVAADCKHVIELSAGLPRIQKSIEATVEQAEAQRQSIQSSVQEAVTSIRQEREQATAGIAEAKTLGAELEEAALAARTALMDMRAESEELRNKMTIESRNAADNIIRSVTTLQLEVVELEQQASSSVAEAAETAVNDNLARFEVLMKATMQRFATGLEAVAFHAFHDDSPEHAGLMDISEEASLPAIEEQ